MSRGRVEITGGFLLLIAWLNYCDHAWILPLALLACSCHELGHYAVIRAMGNDIRRIRLSVTGAEMALERTMGYGQELQAAAAGPLTNLVLAVFFSSPEWGRTFAGINLVLGIFNLLPLGRLDGGRILYCINAELFGPVFASRVRTVLDGILGLLLLSLGVLLCAGGNCTLLLVVFWLLILPSYRKRMK